MQSGVEAVREQFGGGAVAGRASVMAQNFHGFELLVGSYSVAHLRVSQQILNEKGALPEDGVHVYLTDTLESPNKAEEATQPMLFYKKLAEEHERARRVKADARVVV